MILERKIMLKNVKNFGNTYHFITNVMKFRRMRNEMKCSPVAYFYKRGKKNFNLNLVPIS